MIYCLQDTHFDKNVRCALDKEWQGDYYCSYQNTQSRGVTILFNNNFDYNVHDVKIDPRGNFVVIDVSFHDKRFTLCSVYGPNKDTPDFYNNIKKIMLDYQNTNYIICGDWNLVINPELDTHTYVHVNNPKAMKVVLDLINDLNCVDPWRCNNANTKRFTWRQSNPLKQSRLDYFLISEELLTFVKNIDISSGYRTDHSSVVMNFMFNDIDRGRGYWKFNNSLLSDIDYVNLVKTTIKKVIHQYIATHNPVRIYDIHPNDLNFVISDQLLFDMMLLEIRGKTISYSSFKKKESNLKEKQLLDDSKTLEQQHNIFDQPTLDTLNKMNKDLEDIRSKRMEGAMLRSRVKWLETGEKPSAFFLSLEKRNSANKTLNNIIGTDGTNKSTNNDMLNECFNFYNNLYSKNDTQHCQIHDFIKTNDFPCLNEDHKNSLEGPILHKELLFALKHMSNNKSPGIDGFTVEFYKMFFSDLSWFLLRSLNESYDTGSLSVTQNRGVITLLPKGDKPRQYLKNWRPISLLNVSYKLVSTCIANRLKNVLSYLISPDQSGFIAGRFIGENIRQIYDIMSYTESNDIPGLLLLIDFEKAFDSVSHDFIFKTLDLLNFGDGFRKWISVFYSNAQSTVLVNGHMTPFFYVKSGCRQGDGLSPYIFLLCSQILNIAINNNADIKGITINGMDYKMLQYADDTTIILDGSESSLLATLNLLDNFHNISGLKINIDKTNAVWIGSKKGSQEILCKHYKIIWVGVHDFKYLSVILNTDLDAIVNVNYTSTMQAITKQVHHWSKRFLTVLGRIVVVKTLLLPKLNHLVLSLPTPSSDVTKNITSTFYQFIWGSKVDRISRNQMARTCAKRGASMVQFEHFAKALKISWIRRLLKYDKDSKIYNLFKMNTLECNFDYSSSNYWDKLMNDSHNIFWRNVLGAWRDMTLLLVPSNREQVLSSSIWHNANIEVGRKSVFYQNWDKHGIRYINDLLAPNGDFMSLHDIQNTYDMPINCIHFYGIKKAICKSYSNLLCKSTITLPNPYQGFNVNTLLKDKKGCKRFYNIFINANKVQYKCIEKWNQHLNSNFVDNDWFNLSYYNWKSTQDVKLRWFFFTNFKSYFVHQYPFSQNW
jgi:exonuclease III